MKKSNIRQAGLGQHKFRAGWLFAICKTGKWKIRFATACRSHVIICVTKCLASAGARSTLKYFPLVSFDHHAESGCCFSYNVGICSRCQKFWWGAGILWPPRNMTLPTLPRHICLGTNGMGVGNHKFLRGAEPPPWDVACWPLDMCPYMCNVLPYPMQSLQVKWYEHTYLSPCIPPV